LRISARVSTAVGKRKQIGSSSDWQAVASSEAVSSEAISSEAVVSGEGEGGKGEEGEAGEGATVSESLIVLTRQTADTPVIFAAKRLKVARRQTNRQARRNDTPRLPLRK
jgi:hypothetical protein